MKRKILEEVEAEDVKEETHWDFKRLAVGVTILIVILGFGGLMLFTRVKNEIAQKGQTLGISSESKLSKKVPPLPSKDDIQGILKNAQKTLSEISSDNLTSSQAAIQKIITDLESLQQNKNARDFICNVMCKDN